MPEYDPLPTLNAFTIGTSPGQSARHLPYRTCRSAAIRMAHYTSNPTHELSLFFWIRQICSRAGTFLERLLSEVVSAVTETRVCSCGNILVAFV